MIKPILTVAFLLSGLGLVGVATHKPTVPAAPAPVALAPVASPIVPSTIALPEMTIAVALPRHAVALPRAGRVSTRREWTRPLEPCWTPSGTVRVWDNAEPARM
jgi:hypothetical protein